MIPVYPAGSFKEMYMSVKDHAGDTWLKTWIRVFKRFKIVYLNLRFKIKTVIVGEISIRKFYLAIYNQRIKNLVNLKCSYKLHSFSILNKSKKIKLECSNALKSFISMIFCFKIKTVIVGEISVRKFYLAIYNQRIKSLVSLKYSYKLHSFSTE